MTAPEIAGQTVGVIIACLTFMFSLGAVCGWHVGAVAQMRRDHARVKETVREQMAIAFADFEKLTPDELYATVHELASTVRTEDAWARARARYEARRGK